MSRDTKDCFDADKFVVNFDRLGWKYSTVLQFPNLTWKIMLKTRMRADTDAFSLIR